MYRNATNYFWFSLSLFIFQMIYSLFAHGVSSSYMKYVFLVPLLVGSGVSLLISLLPKENKLTSNLRQMGIATVVVGMILHGVFEIYGTAVGMVSVYFYVGFGILAIWLLTYLYIIFKQKNSDNSLRHEGE